MTWSKQRLFLVRLPLACVHVSPLDPLWWARHCAGLTVITSLPTRSVYWPIRKEVIWCSEISVCLLFFWFLGLLLLLLGWFFCFLFLWFFLFFVLLCFVLLSLDSWGEATAECNSGLIERRRTYCCGSARVYILSAFPEVSILQTQQFPVSFLLVLIFIEIVPE